MKRYKILSLAVLVVSFSVPVPAFFLVLPAQQSYPDGGYLKVNPPPQPFRLFTDQQEVTKVRAAPAGNAGDDNPFTFMFSEKNEPQQLKKLDGTPISFEEVAKLYGKEDGMRIYINGEDIVNKYNLEPQGIDLSNSSNYWNNSKIQPGTLAIDPRLGRFILQVAEFDSLNERDSGFLQQAGPSRDVYIKGNYVYAVEDGVGLKVIDNTNPKQPRAAGPSFTINDSLYRLKVVGNYAYLAGEKTGLWIVDITEPKNLVKVANIRIESEIKTVDVVGDKNGSYAYVGTIDGKMQVISLDWDKILSDSDKTIETTELNRWSYNTGGVLRHIKIVGNYAYVAADTAGFHIIDVSNLDSMQGIKAETDGPAKYVDVKGNYAYLALEKGGLQRFNISDTKNPPKFAGSYRDADSNSTYYTVQILGNYAFVGDSRGARALKIFDISNPNEPLRLVGEYLESGGYRFSVVGERIFISNPFKKYYQTASLIFNYKPIPEGSKVQVGYNY